MRFILVLMSLLTVPNSLAFAQSSSGNKTGAGKPPDKAIGTGTEFIGANPAQGRANDSSGARTSTGTAAPNTTGSSSSSGTNGVDSSTSESH
jgi:hypothetical protein